MLPLEKTLLASIIAFASSATVLHASFIYEPFDQPAGPLNGQAGGTGLNTWTAASANIITPPTLSYGNVPHSGGQVEAVAGGNGGVGSVTTTSVLLDAGLLDDGATLWFSTVFQGGSSGVNQHSGFGFGSAAVTGAFNGLNMTGGNGVGFYFRQGALRAAVWEAGVRTMSGTLAASASSPQLVVGKIEWGATAGDVERITLYNITNLSDLSEPTTTVSVTTAAPFSQTALNLISFANRDTGTTPQIYDEIRFGASFADVTTTLVPEPASLTLLGLGGLGVRLLRHRRG